MAPQARRKKPRANPTLNGLTAQQLFDVEDFDPLLELIKLCRAQYTVRDEEGNILKDEDGKPRKDYVLEPKLRVEALKSMIEFGRPKLRTQEVKETLDVNFQISINRFDKPDELPEVIEVPAISNGHAPEPAA